MHQEQQRHKSRLIRRLRQRAQREKKEHRVQHMQHRTRDVMRPGVYAEELCIEQPRQQRDRTPVFRPLRKVRQMRGESPFDALQSEPLLQPWIREQIKIVVTVEEFKIPPRMKT